MAGPWEDFAPSEEQGPWSEFAQPAAATKKQVGVVEGGVRGVRGKFAAGMERLGNIAMLPVIGAEVVANQFRDTPNFGMTDYAASKFTTPWQQMSQADAIQKGEEMTLPGTIANVIGSIAGMFAGSPESFVPAGQAINQITKALTPAQQAGNIIGREFVKAQPMAQTNMIGRSNELQAQGVPKDIADAATMRSYGSVDAAAFALPLSAAGGLLRRGATGGGAMVATEVPSVAVEGDTLRAYGQGDKAQDPFDPTNLATSGGIGAALAMMMGQRAPRMQTADSVQAGRDLDAQAQADMVQQSIVPDSGISIADLIQSQLLNEAPPMQDVKARRSDAATALGNKPEDPIIYQRESMDPVTGEMLPTTEAGTGTLATNTDRLAGQRQAFEAEQMGGRPVDPDTAAAYGEAGIDPNSVASAFERSRLPPNTDPDVRSLKAELGPDELGLIERYTGMTADEVAALGPNSQRRVLARAMEAQQADAERPTLATSYGEDMLSSPASKPDVPGDRMPGRGEYEDKTARTGTETPASPEVAKRAAEAKAKMLEKLDDLRKQKDRLDSSETRRELKRKADLGLTMTDNERKAHANFTAQRDKLNQSIFDLEGKIYDTEARSEQGSKTATGTSDRPFSGRPAEPGSFEEAARPEAEARARAEASRAEQEMIDRLEAEWRARNDARKQEQAQNEAGKRKQADTAGNEYAGKKGSTTEAPLEGGKFKADANGFVMSDNGSPLQFGHQRDAGWWILKRGNKGNTGQVFEIHNHPSGKGYTVRVTHDNGGGNGRSAGIDGSPGNSRMEGNNLVPRGTVNRSTGNRGRGDASARGNRGDSVEAGPVADEGIKNRAVDEDPRIVSEVEWMAENAGTLESGGRMVRDPVTGEASGRTEHIPIQAWWYERPSAPTVGKKGKEGRRFLHSKSETQEAVRKWLKGEKLTAKQQQIVDFMRDWAKQERQEQADIMARKQEDAESARQFDKQQADEEARLEREAIQAEQSSVNDIDFGKELGGQRVTVDEFEAWLGGVDEQRNNQGNAGEANARAPEEGGRERGSDAQQSNGDNREAQSPILERPTPDDIRARDDAARAADEQRRADERKAEVDAEPFVMTGSPRAVDEAEARGQRSLLDEPTPPKGEPIAAKVEQVAPKEGEAQGKEDAAGGAPVVNLSQRRESKQAAEDRADAAAERESEAEIADVFSPKTKLKAGDKAVYEGKIVTLVEQDGRHSFIIRDKDGDTTYGVYDWKLKPVGPQRTRPGAGTLSANPFFDPAVWAQAAKDAGFALKTVAKALQDAYGWTERETGAFGRTLKELRKDFFDSDKVNRGSHQYGGFVTRFYRAVFEDAGSTMMAKARATGSQTMQDLVKKFAHIAGDMSGQAETMPMRVEFEWNQQMSPVARALEKVEDLAKSAGRDVDQVMQQVANLVRNPRNIRGGNPIHDAAIAIRKQMDATLKYMREAGVEVGEVKDGYFPREFNLDLALKQSKQFMDALVQAYKETGVPEADAIKLADDLFLSLEFGKESLFKADTGKSQADFLKGRVFGKGVDDPKHPLHKFLEHDPRVAISSYLMRGVKRAEMARIFGESPEAWAEMRKKMIDEGASPDSINDLADFIHTVGGLRGEKGMGREIMAATSWMRTLGTIMFLEKAALTSIPEMIMPAIRAGNIMEAHRSIGTTFKALFMKTNGDIQKLIELADDIGLLSAHMSDTVMMNRWHGGDYASKLQTKIMDRHFKMTGLSQYTEATRMGALAVGQVFVRRLAKGVNGKLNRDYLGEVGIPADKVDAFAKWLTKTNDGMPTAADLRAAPPEMRKLYHTALRKFEADSIMRPNMTTKPLWMSKPVLGLLGQLQSYNYAFYTHVIKRVGKNTWKGLTDSNYSAVERMELAKPLLMLPMLAAMQGLVGEARDALWGDPTKEQTGWQKVVRAFDRGIPIAPISPIVNIFTGAKYQRSAVETVAGPSFGTFARSIDVYADYIMKNSATTNTQERAVVKQMYDAGIEPALAVMLAYGYGNAGLPGKIAMATARQVVGSGQTREAVVTGLQGEQNKNEPKEPNNPGEWITEKLSNKKPSSGGGDSLAVGGF